MAQHSAIVIGSGFGGAVAACRLSQAGFTVKLLERGRRYDKVGPDGNLPFPRGPLYDRLWQVKRGPLDIRARGDVRILQAAGYGGGSLIYANVHLRPSPEVFASGWPEGYSRSTLDPYFDLVAYMLDINPITESRHHPRPTKTSRARDVAVALGRGGQFFYPPLAIDFKSKGDDEHPNKFGVMQKSCDHRGECVMGCPRRAKNTLDLNYLHVAEKKHGAQMLTQCEVLAIEPLGGARSGYRVQYVDHATDARETAEAEYVFVCAGAVNSAALLLKCRAEGTLPRLSQKLGTGYSGNADMLMLAFDTRQPWEPSNGPTITTGLVYSRKRNQGNRLDWFLVEDGGFSRDLWHLLELANPLFLPALETYSPPMRGRSSAAEGLAINPPSREEIDAALREASRKRLPIHGRSYQDGPSPLSELPPGMANTAMVLVMGRDLARGRIELLPDGDVLLKWDVPSNAMLYSQQMRLGRDIACQLGGNFTTSPLWRYLHQAASVHNLGGCPMGTSSKDGVTDHVGEVFEYPNLFVMDGSILPASTGVNPSSTIAAIAERNIERVIRRITGNSSWTAPERQNVVPYADPLDSVKIPPEGTALPETPALGIKMRETLRGSWQRAGEGTWQPVVCRLQITITDLSEFVEEPAHRGVVTGTVDAAGLTQGEAKVFEGVWNLFVAPDEGPDREMRYTLPFIGQDGAQYTLRGTKRFRRNPGLRLWRENTVLHFKVHRKLHPEDMEEQMVGHGQVRISLLEVLKWLLSFEP
ncbi:MAG TPA: GMC family oxidoreductase, partial [Kofleriaceae bacterium]|nr:GMC family oxidoreductase [Kofleriaceae bacterium]